MTNSMPLKQMSFPFRWGDDAPRLYCISDFALLESGGEIYPFTCPECGEEFDAETALTFDEMVEMRIVQGTKDTLGSLERIDDDSDLETFVERERERIEDDRQRMEAFHRIAETYPLADGTVVKNGQLPYQGVKTFLVFEWTGMTERGQYFANNACLYVAELQCGAWVSAHTTHFFHKHTWSRFSTHPEGHHPSRESAIRHAAQRILDACAPVSRTSREMKNEQARCRAALEKFIQVAT